MAKVVVGRGKNRATVDGPDAQELEALVREALGDAVKILDSAVEEVFDDVKKTWPVFTATIINIDALLRRHSHSREPRRGRASA